MSVFPRQVKHLNKLDWAVVVGVRCISQERLKFPVDTISQHWWNHQNSHLINGLIHWWTYNVWHYLLRGHRNWGVRFDWRKWSTWGMSSVPCHLSASWPPKVKQPCPLCQPHLVCQDVLSHHRPLATDQPSMDWDPEPNKLWWLILPTWQDLEWPRKHASGHVWKWLLSLVSLK